MKEISSCLTVLLIVLTVACSKGSKDDDNGGGGGGGGDVKITGTSPEYVVWGDRLTITGSGFSTKKEDNFVWFLGDGSCDSPYMDSTGWRKAEVLSASATKLEVKVPWTKIAQSGMACGHSYAQVRVIVNGKMAESPDQVYCVGWPLPVGFCYWYGGAYYAPGAVRVGDSAMIEYGGFSVNRLGPSGNLSKVRLTVDGKPVPLTHRPGVSGCDSRAFTFLLDANEFGNPSTCEKDSYWGGPGMKRTFKFYIQDQPQSESSKEFWVFSLPKAVYSGVSGPTTVSKGVGGNPQWNVTGRNMYYPKVRFIAQQPCSGTVESQTTCTNEFCGDFVFSIPLSLLNANCTYTVALVDICGDFKVIGSVLVNP